MNELLSLLAMIIIGEGVIGVSKTVGYLWPTEEAPSAGSVVAMVSMGPSNSNGGCSDTFSET